MIDVLGTRFVRVAIAVSLPATSRCSSSAFGCSSSSTSTSIGTSNSSTNTSTTTERLGCLYFVLHGGACVSSGFYTEFVGCGGHHLGWA